MSRSTTRPHFNRLRHRAMLVALMAVSALSLNAQGQELSEEPSIQFIELEGQPDDQQDGQELAQTTDTARSGEQDQRLLYTTYFYTAGEAVIHAYEDNTNARIISMSQGGTIWQQTLNDGETAMVPTGTGVF